MFCVWTCETGGGGAVNEKFSPLDEYFVGSPDSAFTGVPQFGQNRMFSGMAVLQFEQERIDVFIVFFPSIMATNDGLARANHNAFLPWPVELQVSCSLLIDRP